MIRNHKIMAKRALIYYQNTLAGYLSETDEGFLFEYSATYLESGEAKPVSLTLPLQTNPFRSNVLFAFFDGLIPEGWLLNVGKEYWKLQTNDRFELLTTLCRDAIGAVSVIPEEEVKNV